MKTSFKLKPLSNTTVPAKKFIPTFVPYIKGHNEGFPELSLLQAEQPQFFQCFLIDKISHSSDHFCDPLLDLFHQVHALPVLKNPELDAVCQVGLTTVEYRGQNSFPWPVDHTSDAAQATIVFPGYELILPALIQLFIHQYSQVICRAVLNLSVPSLYW